MLGNQINLTNNVAKQVVSVTATQNQTDFTVEGGYRINQLGVYRNGVRQVDGRDYIARNGATVTLLSQGANAGDAMEFVVFDDFRVADALSVNTGGTVNANVNITGALQLGTGTSIFSPADNVLTFGTNSNERVRINSSGLVGINTDNPQSAFLHVGGAVRLGRTNTIREGGAILLDRAADGTIAYELDVYGEGDGNAGAFRIVDSQVNKERVVVSAGGSVGIGTDPVDILTLGDSVNQDQRISIFSNAVATDESYGSIVFRFNSANSNKNAKISALRQGSSSGANLDLFYQNRK